MEDVLKATEVPASNEVQCGWAANHTLEGAQQLAKGVFSRTGELVNRLCFKSILKAVSHTKHFSVVYSFFVLLRRKNLLNTLVTVIYYSYYNIFCNFLLFTRLYK